MIAGRELDALIAEKVMGVKSIREPRSVHVGRWVGFYSTDIAAAWTVADKLWPEWEFDLDRAFVRRGGWLATFNNGGIAFDAEADTAPLAICSAALKVWT